MTATILITRPTESSKSFAVRLRKRLGSEVDVIVSPLLGIKPVATQLNLDGVKSLVFTSMHAVRTFAALTKNRDFICYTVGASTSKAATQVGFDPIEGGGTADLLAQMLMSNPIAQPCLYLRGEHIAYDMASVLKSGGVLIEQAILYAQAEQEITKTAFDALSRPNKIVLPLFSPRSAELFFVKQNWVAELYVAAFSENVAHAVPKSRIQTLAVATEPSIDAMLDVVEQAWVSANELEGGGTAQ